MKKVIACLLMLAFTTALAAFNCPETCGVSHALYPVDDKGTLYVGKEGTLPAGGTAYVWVAVTDTLNHRKAEAALYEVCSASHKCRR